MSMELANAGLQVVCLERGRMVDPNVEFVKPFVHDELKYDRHNDFFQNLSRETITFRNHSGQTALPMRELGSFKPGEMVGGSSALWGAQAKRQMPFDFEMRSALTARYGEAFLPRDSTIQDWGLTWDEVEPYYDQFEHIFGVGGKAGNLNGEIQPGGSPHEGPRSREFPNPPTRRTPQGALFADAAGELGFVPYQFPSAAMTQDYRNLYKVMLPRCRHGGFCTSHVCAEGAKATPLTAVLPALYRQKTFQMRPLCNVTRINLDSTGKLATGVTYIDARGDEVEQPAGLVVLAAYCFNNTRLLLLSGIGTPYDPHTGRGVVGRNYSFQTCGTVSVFFDDKDFNPFIGGGSVHTAADELLGDVLDRGPLEFVGGAVIESSNQGALPIKSKPVPAGTPRWGSEWKKAVAQYYRRTMNINLIGSCMSYRQNYLDLDPTYKDANGLPLLRMTFDWQENERKMLTYAYERAREIARALKASSHSAGAVPKNYSIVPYQCTHNVGGAVMGADPSTSVVNKYLQSWDVPNVFVVGGSAFPQNSSPSPTATIGMLACWAADAIKETYVRRPGQLM
ncbi:GMC family oxidoreductase [Bradyrhizobium sp. CSA207]|nr:GMC family oxidoreductase [Bradyrhizobium sp. CSA207]